VRKGGKGSSWEKAVADGWVEGKNLFEIDQALSKGTVIMYLLSDAGQKQMWSQVSLFFFFFFSFLLLRMRCARLCCTSSAKKNV